MNYCRNCGHAPAWHDSEHNDCMFTYENGDGTASQCVCPGLDVEIEPITATIAITEPDDEVIA